MDKYEFNIKLEQIKKLAGKKDFKTAAKIAKAMDWRKIKDWTTLSLIINIQESAGDFDEARDIAILAYNRNLGGRRLVYKLTELFMKLGEFTDAEDLYKEYARISQHDVNKYILLYNLRKAQDASADALIEILEEYKDHEIDEKYLAELAELYSKAGRVEDCLRECEEIALWFQDGAYVEKALRIKQHYAKLTASQQKILAEAGKKVEVDKEKIKELKFAKAKERARLLEDEIEDVFREDAKQSGDMEEAESSDDYAASDDQEIESAVKAEPVNGPDVDMVQNNFDLSGVQNVLKSFIKKALGSEEEEDNLDKYNDSDDSDEFDETPISESANSETAEMQDFEADATTDEEVSEVKSSGVESGAKAGSALAESAMASVMAGSANSSEGIAKAGESIRELVANAKRKIESDYEQVRREDEAERLQDEVCKNEVPVANYNLYDTQNVQRELAKSLGELMKDTPDEEMFKAVSFMSEQTYSENAEDSDEKVATESANDTDEVTEEDEQIAGQLSLGDWMEAIQEEKYGKQNTKEFSKAELEKMLEQRENQQEEYEKLLEKLKQQAEEKGELFNEEEARKHAEEQVIVQAAKTDLAIRTGKATAKIEADVENVREAAKLTAQIEERAAKEAERITNEAKIEAELEAAKVVVHQNVFRDIFEDEEDDEEFIEEAEQTADSDNMTGKLSDIEFSDDSQEQQEAYDNMISEYDPEEDNEAHIEIPENVKKYFKKYCEMSGMNEQLAEYFASSKEENLSRTSETGNIIISGNRSSDKTNLAVNIIKALNILYPENPRKIAKTTGESINHKGIVKAMSKLKGTALIVEDAGVIEPKRIKEMLEVMGHDTESMIVIFEDSDTEINVLLSVNPDIENRFNHRIVLKQYTVNELVEMAKKYAGKRQHAIDDNALLQLYLRIDKLHAQVDCVRLDQIKEIIDRAIVKAEKRSSKKFFGAIKKKRGDNGDIFFLAEADFKE